MERSYEFDPSPSGWLVRAYHTPLTDIVRARMTGRYDVRAEIARADLPAAVGGVILAVVRKTKLWRGEKLDVARELVAHFADGLAAGRGVDQLIADFGSVEQSARLIRKAKRRQRPLTWQIRWFVSRLLWALFVFAAMVYGVLALRLWLATPSIEHNFWHEINQARKVASDEAAWPLYRAAGLQLSQAENDTLAEGYAHGPADSDWPELMAILEHHGNAVQKVREAANRKHFGYLIGNPSDVAAAQAANAEWAIDSQSPAANENQLLINANLGGMNVIRSLARLTALDARRAAEIGDSQTVVSDLNALLAMSELVFQPKSFLVEQLVGLAVFNMTVETLGRVLAEHPALLSESQLRDLAHSLASYRNGNLRLDLTAERLAFDDVVQRMYTDDGKGDGRMTSTGLDLLSKLSDPHEVASQPIAAPGIAALIASRAEARRFFTELLDQSIAVRQEPPWQWDPNAISAANARYQIGERSPLARLQHMLTFIVAPAVGAATSAGEKSVMLRNGAETAIALVLYHRRHGAWPERLDQLVPDLLPAVPIDRYTGDPLHYKVRDGKPLLYSVGQDRDDDAGQPASPPEYAMGGFDPLPQGSSESSTSDPAHDGDWILWPPITPNDAPGGA